MRQRKERKRNRGEMEKVKKGRKEEMLRYKRKGWKEKISEGKLIR